MILKIYVVPDWQIFRFFISWGCHTLVNAKLYILKKSNYQYVICNIIHPNCALVGDHGKIYKSINFAGKAYGIKTSLHDLVFIKGVIFYSGWPIVNSNGNFFINQTECHLHFICHGWHFFCNGHLGQYAIMWKMIISYGVTNLVT